MDRRNFLSTSAAALAAPVGLLLGERDAAGGRLSDCELFQRELQRDWNDASTAVEEDCSWRLPDREWRDANGLVVAEYPPVCNSIMASDRSSDSVRFTGNTVAELGSWARGETDLEYDKSSEHLAELLNKARSRIGRTACKIDPGLMADSYHWANLMASHRRMIHASSKSRGGVAEIIAVSEKFTDAVGMWWNSGNGRVRGLFRRRRRSGGGHYGIMIGSQYTKIGAGVVRVRGGDWYCCARYA
ncbi:MAG: CAP domain-containing protein [Planctomycetota bacterium]|nr:CAP domain-containing protein [Planctomycetota bacterium]